MLKKVNYKKVWSSQEDVCAEDQTLTTSYVLGNTDGAYGAGYLLAGGDKVKAGLMPKDLDLQHQATGTIAFTDNPSADEILTINGVAFTFVASGATGNQINIGGDLPGTLDNIIAVLNASTDEDVAKATYTEDGVDTLTITYDEVGAEGEEFSIAFDGDATLSGATLDGAVSLISIKYEMYGATKSGGVLTPDTTLLQTITQEVRLDDKYEDEFIPLAEQQLAVNEEIFLKVYLKIDILANSGEVDVRLASVA
ncbi:MAG: hypothetical protein BV457_00145 [Thermoplasmata archaeon M9B1D]|nr:MAG: hypothetical protein BV457_00145 [Thermoplasmata archaeon M9B1D]PNX52225.1 MAG: hypothetical protein BV456_00150 [Thermoplasmata archaeon M8B2D]